MKRCHLGHTSGSLKGFTWDVGHDDSGMPLRLHQRTTDPSEKQGPAFVEWEGWYNGGDIKAMLFCFKDIFQNVPMWEIRKL